MQPSGSEVHQGRLRSFFLGLRRHTSSGFYVAELDGLRFVAILLVFIYHLSGDVVRHNLPGVPDPASGVFVLLGRLNIGVPLFFAISGMILGLPFARYWLKNGTKVSLKRYFLRRVTRLEPPYVVAMVLFFLLKYFGHRGTIGEMLPHLAASLVYLHGLIYREFSNINSVAWSLEVEVQFYILAPLLATVFAIRNAPLRRATIGVAMLLAAIWTPWLTDLNAARLSPSIWLRHLSLAGNVQYFLAGFLLADFFLSLPPAAHRNRRWDIVTLVGWPLFMLLLLETPNVAFTALPVIILTLYVAVFYGSSSTRAFGTVWVASIGGMCYSIYLLHNYLIVLIGFVTERIGQSLPDEVRFAIQFLIMTPIVLAASISFYLLIEQPCMDSDWPSRLKNFVLIKLRNIPPAFGFPNSAP
ncbi:MAG: acyltransferase [Bryobacteraceae bacterium]